MKLSHSSLSQIIQCPMSYYLDKIVGIKLKEEKSALSIGSAVHYGIEHNTEDLTEYYLENGGFKNRDSFTRDQLLSEAMVHGYLKHKDELFEKILTDENGEKLELLNEDHELKIEAKLKTYLKEHDDHDFVGIIDLLLLTDKGFIICDYKTSSQIPDWDKYQDQLYRYIFLLNSIFPDVPVIKICIINIRKTMIRQKKNENYEEFLNRMKFEYDLNEEDYVNYHEFPISIINKEIVDEYIDNLSRTADFAQTIVDNNLWFINFSNANGIYGKSDYWNIFYKTEGAEVLYKIKDKIYNEETDTFDEYRDCVSIDMKVLDRDKKPLNKYETFVDELKQFPSTCSNDFTEEFIIYLELKYYVDKDLLDKYIKNMSHEVVLSN